MSLIEAGGQIKILTLIVEFEIEEYYLWKKYDCSQG